MAFLSGRKRLLAALAVLALVVLGIGVKLAADRLGGEALGLSAVRVTIGKETTSITGPLRDDGYPDYIAALNQRAGQNVTGRRLVCPDPCRLVRQVKQFATPGRFGLALQTTSPAGQAGR